MNKIKSEHTANLALAHAPAIVAHIGRNFAKPIPRLAKPAKPKSFVQKLIAMGKNPV